MFERFCSPRGQLDEDLLDLETVLRKVGVVCVDGAFLKTADVLRRTRMPNTVLNDIAHVI